MTRFAVTRFAALALAAALSATLVATLPVTPAVAQDPGAQPDAPAGPLADPQAEEGWSLMREGANLLFESFRSEIDPALQGMAEAFAGAEPMLRDLIGMMGEVTNYHPPEILPNGDILIRRKTPAEIAAEPPASETEL